MASLFSRAIKRQLPLLDHQKYWLASFLSNQGVISSIHRRSAFVTPQQNKVSEQNKTGMLVLAHNIRFVSTSVDGNPATTTKAIVKGVASKLETSNNVSGEQVEETTNPESTLPAKEEASIESSHQDEESSPSKVLSAKNDEEKETHKPNEEDEEEKEEHKPAPKKAKVIFPYHEKLWMKRYRALEKFQKENGHCNVNRRDGGKATLRNWVVRQRGLYRTNELIPDRVDRLNQLGFAWDATADRGNRGTNRGTHSRSTSTRNRFWMQKFLELKEYVDKHGDCRVPKLYEGNSSLSSWIYSQRKKHRDEQLSPEQFQLLDGIGFVWKNARSQARKELQARHDAIWDEHFERLQKFVESHGKGVLPTESYHNGLSRWCRRQKKAYKDGSLTRDRQDRLTAVGFPFPGRDEEAKKDDTGALK